MSSTTGELLPAEWLKKFQPFEPGAGYFHAMDHLLYLNENCSYVAQQIDPTLDILWHPHGQRVVGAKICGFAAIVEQDLPRILGPGKLLKALLASSWFAACRHGRHARHKLRKLLHL